MYGDSQDEPQADEMLNERLALVERLRLKLSSASGLPEGWPAFAMQEGRTLD